MFTVIAAVFCLTAATSFGVIRFDNRYYSPRNRERALRTSTTLIILHTTEAPSSSALRKLSDLGECHYCIDEAGRVYRIIDHRRVAYHAGRSMWNGRCNVDDFSVGIEVCGYHNRSLTAAQYQSLADLIGEMQYIYKVPDSRVLSHAHVAYGAPNRWHKRSHRGRKRCGMLYALPSVRARLRLSSRPAYDPDVRAGRLVVGDSYLSQVLYGSVSSRSSGSILHAVEANVIQKGRSAWDIARDAYDDSTTLYVLPDGTQKRGNQIGNFKLLPSGTRVTVNAPAQNRNEKFRVVGVNGNAQDIAGDEVLRASTIYVYPDGRYLRGNQLTASSVLRLPYGTDVLVGYAVGGPITASRPPSVFCGNRWRSSDSFFLLSGSLIPGNKVDDTKLPVGAVFFYKK